MDGSLESHRVDDSGLFDAVPDAIVGITGDARIAFANSQVLHIFGWAPHELVGRSTDVLFRRWPPDDDLQLPAHRRDGTVFTAEIRLRTLPDQGIAGGDPPAGGTVVLASIRDVSRSIEQQQEQARRALEVQRLESLGTLAGGVAHDFNNLLSVIMNCATLAQRRATDPAVAAELADIRTAAERGAALTQQLLAFARHDESTPEALDLNEVVRGVAALLSRSLGPGIAFDLALGPDPVIGMCDRTQLDQILLNLAVNARDAMPDGGTLRISAARSGPSGSGSPHTVVLTVSDTGVGMDPQVAARAFEPFFTTKDRHGGTGLGLATVYGIVQQNGGTATIDSAPGRGTTVTVRLPSGLEHTSAPADPRTAVAGGSERILVVEDEVALRMVTARLLAEHGYIVHTATDGADALELLDRNGYQIDLVLSDIAMPRMRGDELRDQLRRRAPEIPVLLVTGYDSGGAASTGRVLSKPLVEDDLMQAIRDTLDTPR